MAQYGSNNLKVEFADSGATLRDMSSYVRTINGFDVQAILVEGHTFGDTWVKSLFTNIKKAADVVMGGYYNDAASTGPDAVFNAVGASRELKLTWGGTKTSDCTSLILNYKRLPVLNDLTKFEVTVRPSGTVTEA
jgi:hypothetical protein